MLVLHSIVLPVECAYQEAPSSLTLKRKKITLQKLTTGQYSKGIINDFGTYEDLAHRIHLHLLFTLQKIHTGAIPDSNLQAGYSFLRETQVMQRFCGSARRGRNKLRGCPITLGSHTAVRSFTLNEDGVCTFPLAPRHSQCKTL